MQSLLSELKHNYHPGDFDFNWLENVAVKWRRLQTGEGKKKVSDEMK